MENYSLEVHRVPTIRRSYSRLMGWLVLVLGMVIHGQVMARAACPTVGSTTRSGESMEPVFLEDDLPRGARAKYVLEEFVGERAAAPRFDVPDNPREVYGLDVSHWQGPINWPQIPRGSVLFAIAKATEGVRFVDKRFDKNWQQMGNKGDRMRAAGDGHFLRGAYHFFRPLDDPLVQAAHFLERVGPLGAGDMPPTLDVEWDWADTRNRRNDRWQQLRQAQRVACVQLWLDAVEQAVGRKPIIYTNYYFWNETLGNPPQFRDHPLWIADYSNRSARADHPVRIPESFSGWHIWQFTDRGRISGVKGFVDVNRFNGEIEDLLAMAALTGTPPQASAAAPPRRGDREAAAE